LKIAAIDIGSNAIRLLIEEVHRHENQWRIDKVSLTRVPVRLGDDVFRTGRISDEKLRQLVKTMRAFWYLMDVHQVEMFRVCATSAMREAKNRKKVIETVEREANFRIEILSGELEAQLIFENYFHQNLNLNFTWKYSTGSSVMNVGESSLLHTFSTFISKSPMIPFSGSCLSGRKW
jgi:exopolyphosphatase/guanosine-5'-triphosphate,3'-diphosphate pyrophosphatase